MSDAPAGWYPDPTPATAASSLRYWDGQAWTAHVAPASVQEPHGAQQYAAQPYGAHTYGANGYPASSHAQAGPTTPDGVPLASYGQRVLAQLIDLVVIVVPSLLLSLPSQVDSQERIQELSDRYLTSSSPDFGAYWDGYVDVLRGDLLGDLWISLLGFAYIALMLRWKGATLGKLALGVQVRLRERPGRLPWTTIGLRVLVANGLAYLATLTVVTGSLALVMAGFLFMMVFGLLDVLWPAWDSKRQALHDKAARTNVVKVR